MTAKMSRVSPTKERRGRSARFSVAGLSVLSVFNATGAYPPSSLDLSAFYQCGRLTGRAELSARDLFFDLVNFVSINVDH